jgi:alpha-ketoglutarate-dependent taurine dioxygenase
MNAVLKNAALEFESITPAIGAIAHGADLSKPLESDTVRQIRQAMLDRGVVFFRDQKITREQMAAVMANFGTLCDDPFLIPRSIEAPEKTILDLTTKGYSRATAVWHYDSSLASAPASIMGLRALQLPPSGGDTCWGNMYAAYNALSAPLRKMLDGLSAEHSAFKVLPLMGITGPEEHLVADMRNTHPVIRVHPETGRKALFVDELWTERIVELEPAESDALLAMLFEHVRSPVWTMRWRWRVNDMALWDNRAYQHYAVKDYQETRIMQKSLVAGDRPFGPN